RIGHPLDDVDVGQLAEVGRGLDGDGNLIRARRGMEGGHRGDRNARWERRGLQTARVHVLAFAQRSSRRDEVRRQIAARTLTVDDGRVLVSGTEYHPDLGLAVGDETHDARVVERLDHLSDQSAGADDGITDRYPVRASLVE